MNSLSNYHLVFIHGYMSSSTVDWYPTITPLLDQRGISYSIPNLPGGLAPRANEWLDALHPIISKAEKPLILIGHSLGTRTALLYIEKYKPTVELLVLVGAFNNETSNAQRRSGVAYPDFFDHKINLAEIMPCIKKSIVIHSHDDSALDFTQGEQIARELGATLIPFDGRDHFTMPEDAATILKAIEENI